MYIHIEWLEAVYRIYHIFARKLYGTLQLMYVQLLQNKYLEPKIFLDEWPSVSSLLSTTSCVFAGCVARLRHTLVSNNQSILVLCSNAAQARCLFEWLVIQKKKHNCYDHNRTCIVQSFTYIHNVPHGVLFEKHDIIVYNHPFRIVYKNIIDNHNFYQ